MDTGSLKVSVSTGGEDSALHNQPQVVFSLALDSRTLKEPYPGHRTATTRSLSSEIAVGVPQMCLFAKWGLRGSGGAGPAGLPRRPEGHSGVPGPVPTAGVLGVPPLLAPSPSARQRPPRAKGRTPPPPWERALHLSQVRTCPHTNVTTIKQCPNCKGTAPGSSHSAGKEGTARSPMKLSKGSAQPGFQNCLQR